MTSLNVIQIEQSDNDELDDIYASITGNSSEGPPPLILEGGSSLVH